MLKKKYPHYRVNLCQTRPYTPEEPFADADREGYDAWLEAHRLNLCHWVTVDTFDHLKHGGRVSATSAAMGTLLGIKPLIHVDENGKLVAVGKPRGKKKALEALLSNMEKGWVPEISKQVIIGYGDSLDVAKELCDMVAARFPEAEKKYILRPSAR